MPTFTPKFVDLVRNATSVTGTGPVTLGSAVSGFTSFAAAATTGEQFYYCIQGIDKPQEREVGRGTMQANGSIAREAVSGTLTSFTSGAKTISLVAAAEWFSRLDLIGAGPGAGTPSVATRTALAALGTVGAGPIYLTEARRAGLFVFDPSNLSAKVAADPAQGIYIAPAAASSGASGAWVRQDDGPILFDWFGAVAGDYASGISPDCLPAWNALNSYLDATDRNVSIPSQGAGPQIVFPGAQYYFSDTIQIKRTLRLTGMGPGQTGGEPTWLRFPADKAGIMVQQANTIGDTVLDPPTTSGSASIIEGFLLHGGGGGSRTGVVTTDLLYSGIRLRARATIQNCLIRNFRGAGICISAAVDAGNESPFLGNANNWHVNNCRTEGNRTGGLYVSGGDANAGTCIALDATRNGLFGIFDGAFLGNTYIGCHSDANALPSEVGSGHALCMVSHGGNRYYLKINVPKATAQATTPGTNAAVWIFFQVGGATTDWPAWSASGDYAPGGAYGHTGPANACTFVGCYSEGGQMLAQIGGAAQVLGGFMFDGNADGAPHVKAIAGIGTYSQLGFGQRVAYPDGSYANHRVGGDMTGTELELLTWNSSAATAFFDPDRKAALVQDKASGDVYWRDQAGNKPFRFSGVNTAMTFGGRSQPESRGVTQIEALALGNGANAGANSIIQRFGAIVPTTGFHALGEIVWNDGTASAVATIDHWRCTAAGTPGTWVAVGPLSASGSIGYTTGAGGAVTQTGGKSAAVTLHKPSGKITMDAASLGAGAIVAFQFVNSFLGANDVVVVNIASGATLASYRVDVTNVQGGSAYLQLHNISGGALAQAVVLHFAILRGAAS